MEYLQDREPTVKDHAITGVVVTIAILLILSAIVGSLFGIGALIAEYNVWSSGLAGEAQLKQAEWNRKIVVREADAKKEAATLLAEAEVERAKGVATANKIIGDSLKNNEEYLRYLWIDSLQSTKDQIIYVPTEGNLPILEASRLKK
jgi:regulator of protease activity HflC (stomatin/prohibitin superfamily)